MSTQHAPPTNTKALLALIAGVLGWTLLPFLGSVGAIILGHMARADIRRSAGQQAGDGFAVTGLVLGWLSVILWLLGVVLAILFFGGLVAALAALGLMAG